MGAGISWQVEAVKPGDHGWCFTTSCPRRSQFRFKRLRDLGHVNERLVCLLHGLELFDILTRASDPVELSDDARELLGRARAIVARRA